MKYKKYAGIVFAVLCILGFLQLYPFSMSSHSHDTKDGMKVMQTLAKRNVAQIESKIQAIQEQFNVDANDVPSFSARFANTIIMGDSLASGLLEYGIMPGNIVLAERGKRTDNIDQDVQTVINYAPKAVFMEYGINDLSYTRGDAERYISQYKEQVLKIQKALPSTKIYINSLTPISKMAQSKNEYYTHVPDFNKGLETMCKELHITYIDNTHTIQFREDAYEYDGVHPSYPYYPLWLSKMLNAAGL